ncbi:MAG: hypothetical protein R2707_08385 [Acidimicrobiales bacterium]
MITTTSTKAATTMTDPTGMDQAALDRIARLQQRRQPRNAAAPAAATPAAPAAGARPGRRRRRHPAASGRVLAAGLGATTMFGITAALTVEATADTGGTSASAPAVPADTLPANTLPSNTLAADTPSVTEDGALPFEGELPPGFTVDDIDVASIPEGGVLTGEVSEDGPPVVVVFHPRTVPGETVAADVATGAPAASSTPAPAASASPAPAIAAPAPLTPTPVVTAAPAPVVTAAPTPVVTAAPTPVVTAAPAPAPAPTPTTSGS